MRKHKSALLEAEALTTHRVVSLIGCLALVLAPHALRVPLWISALAVATMGLRAAFAWRGYGLPKTWMLAVLALAAAAGTWLSYGMLFGRDAAVALLILMMCLKLMELRTARDANVVVFLGYFAVITNFLYSQALTMGLYLLICVWLITAYLIGMQRQAGPRSIPALLRHSALLLAQAVPVMLVLFLLFPRIQGPLWALPHSSTGGMSGLSDSMSPGSLSSLSLSDAVAFRVEFESPPPQSSRLYWRGPVMWDFDGRTWRVGEGSMSFRREARVTGEPLRYHVTLEPHNMRWMFGIDIPSDRPEYGLISSDFELLSLRPIRTRVRYPMSSYLNYRMSLNESRGILARALRLPPSFNPQAVKLAESWRAQSSDPNEIIRQALTLFREQPFFYTLVPPELGTHSVDEFLFGTRRGFCEHFASSFVVLMRAAGVPARVVTGYQGGVFNPVGGYMIVRQSDAHAWAEVWLDGSGWVRVDPTAAVSPQRIEAGMAAAVPASDPLPLLARADNEWLKRMRFAVDTLTNGWNQWVLGYTQERQLAMLSELTGRQVSWRGVAFMLIIATAIVITLLTLIALRRHRPKVRDQALSAWNTVSRKLSRRGLGREPHEGPRDYVARIVASLTPAQAAALGAIQSLYIRVRYGGDTTGNELAELKRAVREFEV